MNNKPTAELISWLKNHTDSLDDDDQSQCSQPCRQIADRLAEQEAALAWNTDLSAAPLNKKIWFGGEYDSERESDYFQSRL